MTRKIALLILPLALCANWQNTLNTLTNSSTTVVQSSSTKSDGINQDYASKGLKEALGMGVNQAVSLLGKQDGFLNNSAVKIPLPSTLKTVASAAEKMGGKAYVDDFVHTMNTAASKAVPKTASILGDALSSMSIEDAKSIINGKENAATDYFKSKTGDKLLTAIMPIIKESASQSNVMSSYKTLSGFTKSNEGVGKEATALLGQASGIAKNFGMQDALPKEDEDIESYIARKTLDGLFYMIGQKEKALRDNPLSSGSKIIGDIFKK